MKVQNPRVKRSGVRRVVVDARRAEAQAAGPLYPIGERALEFVRRRAPTYLKPVMLNMVLNP